MKSCLQIALVFILVIVATFGVGWLVMGNNLAMQSFFKPKQEEIKRKTFEESKEYQHSTVQELYKMQTEYLKSNDNDFKNALAKRALYIVAEFDKNNLPDDLREWVMSIETINN